MELHIRMTEDEIKKMYHEYIMDKLSKISVGQILSDTAFVDEIKTLRVAPSVRKVTSIHVE